MTSYIDVSAAVHRRAGLGRYAESLARSLVTQAPGRFALFHNRERGYAALQGFGRTPCRSVPLGYKPWRMIVWLAQLSGIGFDRLLPDADLYHATEHLLMPLHQVPSVLTVHDLIFHLFPQHHKKLNYWYLSKTMPLFCDRAAAIITVSRASKRDIVRCYGVPEDKVTVVHEAAASHFCPPSSAEVEAIRQRYGLPVRYVVHVGTIEPRKNLVRLVNAIQQVRDSLPEIGLVIVGKKGWLYGEFYELVTGLPPEAVISLGYVSDEDLPAVYGGAALCAIPSLYEGFGLPVLEAMACGTPVVCSHTSSLPEVGGDAPAYFDPEDTDAMAEVMRRALEDRQLQREMSEKGLAQAASFSWERAAQETMKVYDRVQSIT